MSQELRTIYAVVFSNDEIVHDGDGNPVLSVDEQTAADDSSIFPGTRVVAYIPESRIRELERKWRAEVESLRLCARADEAAELEEKAEALEQLLKD